ncbi:condensation domain-containing protein [Marinomonas mediterranea]|uniref:condensation domain-containing protein n=1 Tax=Marinomonas mediterranea TaxID=119864 RepID=UPI00234B485C|nr:condensation domain-containing protein [Marinomonas mediterranea]
MKRLLASVATSRIDCLRTSLIGRLIFHIMNTGPSMFLQASDICEETPSSVTDYEERIWLLQLQQPEEVSRSISAWKLSEDINLDALEGAILKVIEDVPSLSCRYDFNDEGEVVKYYVRDENFSLSTFSIEVEIPHYLSQRAAFDWQADQHPPCYAAIVDALQERILVLEYHPILGEITSLEGIIDKITQQYQLLLTKDNSIYTSPFERPLEPSQENQSTNNVSPSEDADSVANLILDEFRSVLHEPNLSLEDDFFDWGGHSLLATRVIGKLNQNYGFELNFNDFFRSATSKALALQVSSTNSTLSQQAEPILHHADSAPLTLAQDFLWQAYSGYDFSPIYNLPFAITFLNEVDESTFYKAFEDVLIRHSGLRTQFQVQKGEVTQKIVSSDDLSDYKWFWRSDESDGITLSDEAGYKFDLTQELPLRVRFMARSGGKLQVLSMLVHHMVIDEWSLNTIMQDLSKAYLSRSSDELPYWSEPVPSISEFARSQAQQGVNADHLRYWTKQLEGASKGLNLVHLEPDPSRQEKTGSISSSAEWAELNLGLDAFSKLTTVARQYQTSLFGVLYSAIALSLHSYSDSDEVVIGTSASGRTEANFFDTVGYFTTMVAHRVRFNQHRSVAGLVTSVSEQINDSMSYADIPINLIQEAVGCPIEEGLMFDVYVHIHSNNALNGALKSASGDLFYQQIPPEKNDSMFGLHFEIMDDVLPNGEHSLRIIITYQRERYSKSQIEQLSSRLSQILNRVYVDDLQDLALEQFYSY